MVRSQPEKDETDLGKLCPTERKFRDIERSPHNVLPHVRDEVRRLSDEYQFFHWSLAFPDVIRLPGKDGIPENEERGWCGGFDVIVGNPPWEKVKIQEKEWFAARVPEIANARNAAARRTQIKNLQDSDPITYTEFFGAKRRAEGESHCLRDSGMYPLCGRGDVNTYSVFTELNLRNMSPRGFAGFIVPPGILTDDFRAPRRFFFSRTGVRLLQWLLGAKYVIIDVLFRLFPALKMVLLADYRRSLAAASILSNWRVSGSYVPPNVAADTEVEQHGDEQWQNVLEAIMKQHKAGQLWLILGPSGLGKTALLENWTRHLVDSKRVPFFVPLGSEATPQEEIAALMRQHGDLFVTPETALEFVSSGGFIILLDAFNEDRNRKATKEFIREACNHNVVVMTSQVDPRWDRLLTIRAIQLHPFGSEQLNHLFDDKSWVDRILASEILKHEARLPQTAKMLAEYVRQTHSLPRFGVEVYEDMRRRLSKAAEAPGLQPQVVNFDDQAWNLFRRREATFEPDGALPKQLCLAAASDECRILTRTSEGDKTKYKFQHERIHHFFVARYLFRQPHRPVEKWHESLEVSMDKRDWQRVFEFWAEMLAGLVALQTVPPKPGSPLRQYENFCLDVGLFCPEIFNECLYQQARRLQKAGLFTLEKLFLEFAADIATGIPEKEEIRRAINGGVTKDSHSEAADASDQR